MIAKSPGWGGERNTDGSPHLAPAQNSRSATAGTARMGDARQVEKLASSPAHSQVLRREAGQILPTRLPRVSRVTLPIERTRAVLQTEDFLRSLVGRPDCPDDVRSGARFLLRHFPSKADLQHAAEIEAGTATFVIEPVFGLPDSM